MNNFMNYPSQRNQFSSYFNPANTASAVTNNIVWVQGLEGAKAWQLSPNSMIILLDSEVEGKMYIKVSDNIGMSTLRIFNYTEEIPISSENKVTVDESLDLSQYVKKDELINLIKEILNEQSIPTVAEADTAVTATATQSTTAANNPVNISISSLVREFCPCCEGLSNLTFILTGTAANITNSSIVVIKE